MSGLRRGFTYVEIIIVAAIIAILVTIAVPNFTEARVRARTAQSYADMASLGMAVNSYRLDCRDWPQNSVVGVPGLWDLTVLTTPVIYMTHLKYDAYRSKGMNPVHKDLELAPYASYNAVQVREDGLQALDGSDGLYGGLVPFVLYGLGPKTSFELGKTETVFNTDGTALVRTYDATNGTMSAGDRFLRLP